jgi:hypothetical protein
LSDLPDACAAAAAVRACRRGFAPASGQLVPWRPGGLREAPGEASPSPVYGAALLMRLGLTGPPGFESRSLRP